MRNEETGMTDKEAYDLLLKHAGEQGISLTREMIHIGGMEKAIENTVKVYEEKYFKVGKDFKIWLRQAFNYLVNKSESDN